ncbi:MAG: hypothetical protein WC269_05985 [Candidatus Gracilibacteria bacterium]|jgi:hypothetical protein
MAKLTQERKAEIIKEVVLLTKKNFQHMSVEKDNTDAEKKLNELNNF